jgi:hypothetical protein
MIFPIHVMAPLFKRSLLDTEIDKPGLEHDPAKIKGEPGWVRIEWNAPSWQHINITQKTRKQH